MCQIIISFFIYDGIRAGNWMNESEHTKQMYAAVALYVPLDKAFEYSIPQEMQPQIAPGTLVRVSLGKREINGCVLNITATKSFPHEVKPIIAVLSPDYSIEPELIELAHWLSYYYYSNIGESVNTVSFIGFNDVSAREEQVVMLRSPQSEWSPLKLTPKQQEVVDYLKDKHNASFPPKVIENDLKITRAVIKKLLENGVLIETTRQVVREDEYTTTTISTPLALTKEQQQAYDAIATSLNECRHAVFLLHGVTGSGKTEVYLQIIATALKQERSAIVLVPEISLTPQTVERFRSRFGSLVGVYHSRMSIGQKYDLWQRIKGGEIKIVVGARSAIFSPLPSLGVIVIDEEQEATYKQDTSPRYHARDVAVKRAAMENAVVILGSATPSIESYYHARQGEYVLLRLPGRIHDLPMPKVELIDMAKELQRKPQHMLISEHLLNEIRRILERKEQVIILLNRRGYANFMLCYSCRNPIKCPRCDVTMTYHKTIHKLLCHYCNKKVNIPPKCPVCGSEHLHLMGMGTQRIEEELVKEFPGRHVIRLDMDSISNRFELIKRWEEIVSGTAEIILGTQMVAKGFDLEHVTLVGVISADMSLFFPDFRAGERTFSLLTQVAGRAGRSWRGGKVIVQTFMPEYYAITMATTQDYDAFAEKELAIRKALRFPPYFNLASVVMASDKYEVVREQMEKLGNVLKVATYEPAFQKIDVIGPAPAVISRIRGKFRWRVLLRGDDMELLLGLLRYSMKRYNKIHPQRKVDITVEIDPLDVL